MDTSTVVFDALPDITRYHQHELQAALVVLAMAPQNLYWSIGASQVV